MDASPEPEELGFLVVRPYPAAIRKRVFSYLSSLGYGQIDEVEVGTPDQEAAEQAMTARRPELILLPYHKHQDRDGNWVTGFGVAKLLDDAFVSRRIPVLMPVDEFTFGSSFPRELAALRSENPGILSRLVVMRERDIGAAVIASRLNEVRS